MNQITLNSQAIILLTAYFNKEDKPLTIGEYSKFALWLISISKQPLDLLDTECNAILSQWDDAKITKERLFALLNRGNAMAISMQKWQNAGIWILTRANEEYPRRLKKMLGQKAPPILYEVGNKKILSTKGIAVIGSRNASEDDLSFSFSLGKKIAECGYSVVSGGARGIDESSMFGSIEADGTTIGVLSDGLMQKVLSKKYRDVIMTNNLVLISPYYPDAKFNTGNAMGRNKYIYTLAESSVVVHSGLDGGTWEGAKENIKNRWVPLFVKSNNGGKCGNTKLIEMGGKYLSNNIYEIDNLDFLFEAKEEINKNINEEETQNIEEKILTILSKNTLTIAEVSKSIYCSEKDTKKIIEKLLKSDTIEKHKTRPLKFSKVSKLF